MSGLPTSGSPTIYSRTVWVPRRDVRSFFLASARYCADVTPDELQTLIEDATLDYTLGDHEAALAKLGRATGAAPDSFAAWHALAEVNFHLRRFDDALAAALRAQALQPKDAFINTTLSRIWMEKGDKARAEHFGALAKMLGWKEQLKNSASDAAGPSP